MQQTDDKLTMLSTMATLAKPAGSQPRIRACSSEFKKVIASSIKSNSTYVKESVHALLSIVGEHGIVLS